MKREKLVTINEANLKDELTRVKAERDELATMCKLLLRFFVPLARDRMTSDQAALFSEAKAALGRLEGKSKTDLEREAFIKAGGSID